MNTVFEGIGKKAPFCGISAEGGCVFVVILR